MRLVYLPAALSLASFTSAQGVANCVGGGVCYAVYIPEASASTGSGDIYIQMTGPSALSWIGLAQGNTKDGPNMFMTFSNAAGTNVTLSPRLGVGYREPDASRSNAEVTLLAGSGIENGMMTAIFRCSNCDAWEGGIMSFTDTQSAWLWAYNTGRPVASDEVGVSLSQHSNYGRMTLNLQTAVGPATSNPFSGIAASEIVGVTTDTGSLAAYTLEDNIIRAHGILGSIAFVLFFPIGGIAMRVFSFRNLVWFHAGWMVFTYAMVLACMGLGVWYADRGDYLSSNHAIIGLVVVGFITLQPITGYLHHRFYKRQAPGVNRFTGLHVWGGRAMVTLGIVNGGLGLKLAGSTNTFKIAYSVAAAVVWSLWVGVVSFTSWRARGTWGTERSKSISSGEKPAWQQQDDTMLNMEDRRRD